MDEGFLTPPDDGEINVVDAENTMGGLAGYIKNRFEDSENGRRAFEQRWLQAYKNFKGVYDSSTKYRESERSKVFIKITKTKVLAAYGQVIDILFANKKFPIVVESTPVPEGIVEFAHLKTPADQGSGSQQNPYGFAGDGKELPPGATEVPFGSALLGTGVVKGPFNFYKKVHKWERNPETGEKTYVPDEKLVPRMEHVPVWDFHPDPSATSIEDCEYVIQRHRMNRQQVRALMNRPYFIQSAVENVLRKGPNYEDKYYEDTIREDDTEPY